MVGCATAAPTSRACATPGKIAADRRTEFVRADCGGAGWDRALRQRLVELGLIDGRTAHFDYRWGDGSIDRMQTLAKELAGSSPMLVAMTTPATAALQAATRTIPIVFCGGLRPSRQGFAASLAEPGGNITGFVDIEGSLGGKWLELIHEVAPTASRGAFLFNPQTAPFARYYLETFRSSAAALNIEPIESAVHTAAEVEAAMTKLGREGGVGIIVMPETSTGDYGEAIISLADRYLLPTIYPFSVFVTAGGLMSYGVNYPICFATRRPMWTV